MTDRTLIYFSILLAAIAVFTSFCAEARPVLNLHIGSYHDGPGYWSAETREFTEFNESNPGLGLGWTFNEHLEIRGGGYKNSHHKNSFYLAGAAYTSTARLVSIGLVAGALTGYKDTVLHANPTPENPEINYAAVQPFAMPVVLFNTGPVRTEIGYMPSFINGTYSVFTFTTGVQF